MDRKLIFACALLLMGGAAFAQTIAPVKTVPAKIQSISEVVEGNGIIDPLPEDNIPISADSPMRILEILVKPGDQVTKGQLVVKLQRDHSVEVEVQKARIAMEKDSLDYDRAKTLYDKGVYPKVRLENAKSAYELSLANYQLQQNNLAYAIQNSELKSPINGVVTSVNGAVGEIADPAQPILRIVNLNHMIAIIGIETEDINKVKEGQPADISIPNLLDDRTFEGVVSKLNREIDPATQLIHIWIQLQNPQQLLQPGMFAEARVVVQRDSTALVVPKSAVLKDNEGSYVYVIQTDTAKKVHVKTGISNDTLIQILSGIKRGEPVVYEGNYELIDNMKVSVQK